MSEKEKSKKTLDDEKQTAERKLLDAELLYHTLFNQSPDGILLIDAAGTVVEFNEAAHRQLGYTREEFKGLHLSDVDPFQSPEEIQASIRRVLESGSDEFEVRHRTKTGEIRDVHVITQLMSLSGRTAFHTIWRDITEHKGADKALEESEKQYRTLFEGSPDAILIADPETGKILDANPAAGKLLARKREEIIGLHQSELHPPGTGRLSRQNFEQHVEETRRRGVTHLMENSVLRADGKEVPVEILARSVTIKGKQVILGVFRDISERRQMEEALRKSEKFVGDILETVDEGFVVIDRDYRILSANKAYLGQVKLPLEEVRGRHCYEISHRKSRPCFELGEECSVKHAFDRGEPHTALHIHRDSEKNPIYVETKSFPLKDQSGNTVSAIEIINNTTEKRKLEEQLRHAQKMEAVGQLAGGIAHDFNNILTAITGYGSLMKMKMDGYDPAKNYLQQILDSAQRAANLTRGLLAFSRKQIINPRLVQLNTIIENVEKLLRRLIGEDIELKVILADEDMTVLADSGQIEQVLVNLATNARDAMPDGGCLTIQTEPRVLDDEFVKLYGYGNPGLYACVTVADTGEGMDKKTKERIFEPFYTTKEVGKGTGLGLSIVYGIVQQHGGHITCYSEPGRGAIFKIYLPTIKREAQRKGTDVVLPAAGGTETVLVAEDDAAVRALVKEVLEQSGYTVVEAVDGEDAVRAFARNRDKVRLLILDVIMPKKNGKEVSEEIRKDRPGVKVIFTSGYTADIINKKGIPEENLNFLSKPVSPTELLRKVRETLDKEVPKTKLEGRPDLRH